MRTITIPSDYLEPCRCGTKPAIGDEFWYRSKYGSEVRGRIGKIHSSTSIISTKGALYNNREIEIKPKDIIREEKLNELGI